MTLAVPVSLVGRCCHPVASDSRVSFAQWFENQLSKADRERGSKIGQKGIAAIAATIDLFKIAENIRVKRWPSWSRFRADGKDNWRSGAARQP